MRYTMLAVLAVAIGIATPALAARKQTKSEPAWNVCFRIAMERGVHLELDELPGFMDECIAGRVPFNVGSLNGAKRNRQ